MPRSPYVHDRNNDPANEIFPLQEFRRMEERLVKPPDTGPAEEVEAPGQLDPPNADGSRTATRMKIEYCME